MGIHYCVSFSGIAWGRLVMSSPQTNENRFATTRSTGASMLSVGDNNIPTQDGPSSSFLYLRPREDFCCQTLHSLKLTAISHLKIGRNPKGSRIVFQSHPFSGANLLLVSGRVNIQSRKPPEVKRVVFFSHISGGGGVVKSYRNLNQVWLHVFSGKIKRTWNQS